MEASRDSFLQTNMRVTDVLVAERRGKLSKLQVLQDYFLAICPEDAKSQLIPIFQGENVHEWTRAVEKYGELGLCAVIVGACENRRGYATDLMEKCLLRCLVMTYFLACRDENGLITVSVVGALISIAVGGDLDGMETLGGIYTRLNDELDGIFVEGVSLGRGMAFGGEIALKRGQSERESIRCALRTNNLGRVLLASMDGEGRQVGVAIDGRVLADLLRDGFGAMAAFVAAVIPIDAGRKISVRVDGCTETLYEVDRLCQMYEAYFSVLDRKGVLPCMAASSLFARAELIPRDYNPPASRKRRRPSVSDPAPNDKRTRVVEEEEIIYISDDEEEEYFVDGADTEEEEEQEDDDELYFVGGANNDELYFVGGANNDELYFVGGANNDVAARDMAEDEVEDEVEEEEEEEREQSKGKSLLDIINDNSSDEEEDEEEEEEEEQSNVLEVVGNEEDEESDGLEVAGNEEDDNAENENGLEVAGDEEGNAEKENGLEVAGDEEDDNAENENGLEVAGDEEDGNAKNENGLEVAGEEEDDAKKEDQPDLAVASASKQQVPEKNNNTDPFSGWEMSQSLDQLFLESESAAADKEESGQEEEEDDDAVLFRQEVDLPLTFVHSRPTEDTVQDSNSMTSPDTVHTDVALSPQTPLSQAAPPAYVSPPSYSQAAPPAYVSPPSYSQAAPPAYSTTTTKYPPAPSSYSTTTTKYPPAPPTFSTTTTKYPPAPSTYTPSQVPTAFQAAHPYNFPQHPSFPGTVDQFAPPSQPTNPVLSPLPVNSYSAHAKSSHRSSGPPPPNMTYAQSRAQSRAPRTSAHPLAFPVAQIHTDPRLKSRRKTRK